MVVLIPVPVALVGIGVVLAVVLIVKFVIGFITG